MALFEATEVTLEPGVYRATLKSIVEAERSNFNTGEPEACFDWTYEVQEEGYEGQTLRGRTSTSFGPSSKARAWVEGLLGRKIEAGEKLDAPDLIGKPCDLSVKHKETERGTFANIESVNPVRKKSRKVEQMESKQARDALEGRQPVPDSPNDKDIEDIPF